jgi:hypothetical protein
MSIATSTTTLLRGRSLAPQHSGPSAGPNQQLPIPLSGASYRGVLFTAVIAGARTKQPAQLVLLMSRADYEGGGGAFKQGPSGQQALSPAQLLSKVWTCHRCVLWSCHGHGPHPGRWLAAGRQRGREGSVAAIGTSAKVNSTM